jgi:hypothetical protein
VNRLDTNDPTPPKMKKGAAGAPFFILAVGARYVNYMQIELEPFPLSDPDLDLLVA